MLITKRQLRNLILNEIDQGGGLVTINLGIIGLGDVQIMKRDYEVLRGIWDRYQTTRRFDVDGGDVTWLLSKLFNVDEQTMAVLRAKLKILHLSPLTLMLTVLKEISESAYEKLMNALTMDFYNHLKRSEREFPTHLSKVMGGGAETVVSLLEMSIGDYNDVVVDAREGGQYREIRLSPNGAATARRKLRSASLRAIGQVLTDSVRSWRSRGHSI